MEPRDAATLMLLRDVSGGVEVLMLRRRHDSGFVPGAYVFPGGAVDGADHLDPSAVAAHTTGLTDDQASTITGVASGGLAFWVAAVRETFEEAGVLVASRSGDFAHHRRMVDDGGPLIDVCREERLRLRLGDIHYFGRWITPLGPPRRYDTRFFVTAAPPGQVPSPDGAETVEELWIRPVEALTRHEAGRFELIIPTVRSLNFLSRFDSSADAIEAVASATVCHRAPSLVEDNGGWRIRRPARVGGD